MDSILDKIKAEYAALKAKGHAPTEIKCGKIAYTDLCGAIGEFKVNLNDEAMEPLENSVTIHWNGSESDDWELV